MAKPKEESPKSEDVAAEEARSPLFTWLDKLPQQLAALVNAESSKHRLQIADGLIAELETLHKPV